MESDFWDITASDLTTSLPDWVRAFQGDATRPTPQPTTAGIPTQTLIIVAVVAVIVFLLVRK
jgi:hypothetical protein